MQELLTVFHKWPYQVRVVLLTAYIAVVNSYALFIVYPAIKTIDPWTIISSLLIYGLLTTPLLLFIIRRFQPRPRFIVIGAGLLLMVVATIIQYLVSHASLPTLLLHIVFYLFAGMIEETLWRGKLWQLVNQKINNTVGVLAIVTAHFVALHIPFALLEKQSAVGFLTQVLALGILLGVLRIVTKKVTVPAFAHAIINMVVYS